MQATETDPVCGMRVDAEALQATHEGIKFAFCSEQCRQRFLANPHLYIGVPGEKAPRQKGAEVIKRRRFRLDGPLSGADATLLKEGLEAMMGIKEVQVVEDTVAITYDLLQATAEQIEARIGEIGLHLESGWGERLQRGFIHYFEECEVENLEVAPRRGCH